MDVVVFTLMSVACVAGVATSVNAVLLWRVDVARAADRVSLAEMGWTIAVAVASCAAGAFVLDDRTPTYDDTSFAGLVFGIGGVSLLYLARTYLGDRRAALYEWGSVLFAGVGAILFGIYGL